MLKQIILMFHQKRAHLSLYLFHVFIPIFYDHIIPDFFFSSLSQRPLPSASTNSQLFILPWFDSFNSQVHLSLLFYTVSRVKYLINESKLNTIQIIKMQNNYLQSSSFQETKKRKFIFRLPTLLCIVRIKRAVFNFTK